jgi:hypothetical protein
MILFEEKSMWRSPTMLCSCFDLSFRLIILSIIIFFSVADSGPNFSDQKVKATVTIADQALHIKCLFSLPVQRLKMPKPLIGEPAMLNAPL